MNDITTKEHHLSYEEKKSSWDNLLKKKKRGAIINSSLYKLEFLIVRFGFLSLFGVKSTKNMSEYSDPIVKKLELFLAKPKKKGNYVLGYDEPPYLIKGL